MSRQYSEPIASAVRDCLDGDFWKYVFNEEKGLFKFHVGLSGTVRDAMIVIDIQDRNLVFYGLIPISAKAEDEKMIRRVQDYIFRVNWELPCGCFELDTKDGELRFRKAVNCDDTELTTSAIRDMISTTISAINKYSEGFAGIVLSGYTTEEAIRRTDHYEQITLADSLKERIKKGYSKEIAASICGFLDEDGWPYSFEEDGGRFHFGVNLKNNIENATYEIDVKDDMYIVYLQSPIGVIAGDEETMKEMKDFFIRTNYDLLYGSFDLNVFNGNIRFKFSIECSDGKPSNAVVCHSIVKPAMTFDKFANGIISLIYSGATANQAIELCADPED